MKKSTSQSVNIQRSPEFQKGLNFLVHNGYASALNHWVDVIKSCLKNAKYDQYVYAFHRAVMAQIEKQGRSCEHDDNWVKLTESYYKALLKASKSNKTAKKSAKSHASKVLRADAYSYLSFVYAKSAYNAFINNDFSKALQELKNGIKQYLEYFSLRPNPDSEHTTHRARFALLYALAGLFSACTEDTISSSETYLAASENQLEIAEQLDKTFEADNPHCLEARYFLTILQSLPTLSQNLAPQLKTLNNSVNTLRLMTDFHRDGHRWGLIRIEIICFCSNLISESLMTMLKVAPDNLPNKTFQTILMTLSEIYVEATIEGTHHDLRNTSIEQAKKMQDLLDVPFSPHTQALIEITQAIRKINDNDLNESYHLLNCAVKNSETCGPSIRLEIALSASLLAIYDRNHKLALKILHMVCEQYTKIIPTLATQQQVEVKFLQVKDTLESIRTMAKDCIHPYADPEANQAWISLIQECNQALVTFSTQMVKYFAKTNPDFIKHCELEELEKQSQADKTLNDHSSEPFFSLPNGLNHFHNQPINVLNGLHTFQLHAEKWLTHLERNPENNLLALVKQIVVNTLIAKDWSNGKSNDDSLLHAAHSALNQKSIIYYKQKLFKLLSLVSSTSFILQLNKTDHWLALFIKGYHALKQKDYDACNTFWNPTLSLVAKTGNQNFIEDILSLMWTLIDCDNHSEIHDLRLLSFIINHSEHAVGLCQPLRISNLTEPYLTISTNCHMRSAMIHYNCGTDDEALKSLLRVINTATLYIQELNKSSKTQLKFYFLTLKKMAAYIYIVKIQIRSNKLGRAKEALDTAFNLIKSLPKSPHNELNRSISSAMNTLELYGTLINMLNNDVNINLNNTLKFLCIMQKSACSKRSFHELDFTELATICNQANHYLTLQLSKHQSADKKHQSYAARFLATLIEYQAWMLYKSEQYQATIELVNLSLELLNAENSQLSPLTKAIALLAQTKTHIHNNDLALANHCLNEAKKLINDNADYIYHLEIRNLVTIIAVLDRNLTPLSSLLAEVGHYFLEVCKGKNFEHISSAFQLLNNINRTIINYAQTELSAQKLSSPNGIMIAKILKDGFGKLINAICMAQVSEAKDDTRITPMISNDTLKRYRVALLNIDNILNHLRQKNNFIEFHGYEALLLYIDQQHTAYTQAINELQQHYQPNPVPQQEKTKILKPLREMITYLNHEVLVVERYLEKLKPAIIETSMIEDLKRKQSIQIIRRLREKAYALEEQYAKLCVDNRPGFFKPGHYGYRGFQATHRRSISEWDLVEFTKDDTSNNNTVAMTP